MLKNRKARPPNGPGANGLRGGTNHYSTKTNIGRWQDDIGGPIAFKRGFNTPEFETEAQHQQKGVTLKSPVYYGSELVKSGSPYPVAISNWDTTARLLGSSCTMKQTGEFEIPASNVHGEKLDEYRQTWTSDVPASRNMRYQTESKRATSNMPLKYQTASIRIIPGTPRALEKLRELLIEQHGILAFMCMRHHVGTGTFTADKLRKAISDMEIKLSREEIDRILAFLPSLTAEHFIKYVVAKIDGFESISPSTEHLFDSLFGESTVGVTVEHLINTFNSKDYSEVVEGVSMYLHAYSHDTPGVIIREEFDLMLKDFYSSIPLDYEKVLVPLFK